MKQQIIQLCKAGLAGIMILCLTGCYQQAAGNLERSRQLRVGMTKAEVLKIMGDPVKEEFSTPDRWYYFIAPVWGDGFTTEEECMPLIFEKGKLAGWGNKFYATWRASKELKPEADELDKPVVKKFKSKKSKKSKAKKSEIKQAEEKKPEAKQPEVKKNEEKKPEAKQPEVKKNEEKKTEEKKPEVKQPEVKKVTTSSKSAAPQAAVSSAAAPQKEEEKKK